MANDKDSVSGAEPHAGDVRAAVARILDGDTIGGRSRLRAMLAYLVDEELSGRGELLKAYAIGVDVFGRGSTFDPNTDSIVRVEAGRLRQALDAYYDGPGINDPIRVAVPKGSYRPTFSDRQIETATAEGTEARGERGEPGVGAEPLPDRPRYRKFAKEIILGCIVACLVGLALGYGLFADKGSDPPDASSSYAIPLKVFGGPIEGLSAEGMADQDALLDRLRFAIARNNAVAVVESEGTGKAMFRVTARTWKNGAGERMTLSLIDSETSALVWARSYPVTDDGVGAAVDIAARDLFPEIFTAYKDKLAKRDPRDLSAEQLFVLATWVPGAARSTLEWEQERVRLARMAVVKDPNFGPAHSVLVDKLAYLSSVDPPSHDDGIEAQVTDHLSHVLERSPRDANALFNIGIGQWHLGRMTDTKRTMQRVLELNPNHGLAKLVGELAPYTCIAAPDEILEKAMGFDASLAADNPLRWVTLTWQGILHLNRGELDKALTAELMAAQIFQTPDSVMRRAVVLSELGMTEKARALVGSLKENWPNTTAKHFATVTIPRRCHEVEAEDLLGAYDRLATAME